MCRLFSTTNFFQLIYSIDLAFQKFIFYQSEIFKHGISMVSNFSAEKGEKKE